MDSLTQIVLGAAVGEAVLGRKLGNRALLWGAIAGTIPDLDVIPGAFMEPIDNLIFHRGATHSLLFAFIAPVFFSWLATRFYTSGLHQVKGYKWFQTVLALGLPLVPAGLLFLSAFRTSSFYSGLIATVLLAVAFLMWRYFKRNYLYKELSEVNVSFTSWYIMFFFGFLTHTLLDCFTTYGTMLLWPFSDARISWDGVNVIDPFYTVPLMICLLIAMNYHRSSLTRRIWNAAGLTVSTGYLFLGLFLQSRMLDRFDSLLQADQIQYSRMMCTPTILNNMLWYCLADTETGFVNTYISFLDDPDYSYCLNHVESAPPNSTDLAQSRAFKTLDWFSNGYYQLVENDLSGTLIYRDLRFGNFDFYCTKSEDFIFEFHLDRDSEGEWQLEQKDFQPDERTWILFQSFLGRVAGKRE